MQKRHSDSRQYFEEQGLSTEKHILPFIESVRKIEKGINILEIGCGEGGNMKPFLDKGCRCTGVDFSKIKIELGRELYANHPLVHNLQLISENIYDTKEFESNFDLIILRDVIEHIHNQDKFLGLMKTLLAPNGIAFFAFPPWQNPFGGHQQICESKLLSALPYYHLLPKNIYKAVLKTFGESDAKITTLLEIKETGISIERFEKIFRKNGYHQIIKTLFFINPNYEIKFGLKPRKLYSIIASIPGIRNLFATCGYYVIAQN